MYVRYVTYIIIHVIELLSSGIKSRGIQIITALLGHGKEIDDKVDKEWVNESWRKRGWR